MYLYSILLLFERMFRMGNGERFDILASSSRISGMQYSFLSSGFTKYFKAWIHKFTSQPPCCLHKSIMSSSLFLAMQKFKRSSLMFSFLHSMTIPSSNSYILNKTNKWLLSGFFVVCCKLSRIFSVYSSLLEGDSFIISKQNSINLWKTTCQLGSFGMSLFK